MLQTLRDSRLLSLLFAALAAVVVIATLLRLTGLGAGRWPAASVTAFALYAVPVVVALALAALVVGQRVPAALLTICALAVGLTAVSRARPNEQPAASGLQVRVTSANLLKGRADAAALAAIVKRHRTDVLALQEVTPGTEARLRRAGVFDELPYFVARSPGRLRDTALASRWPLKLLPVRGLSTVYLVATADVPTSGGRPATTLPLVSAHPLPPIYPSAQGPWERWLAELPGPEGPLAGGLVAGDFNATLDHQQFQAVLDRGWRDAADEAGEGLRPTWKGGASMTPTQSLRLTIDHILVPPGAAVRGYAIDALPGSDHRALTATVVLPETVAAQ